MKTQKEKSAFVPFPFGTIRGPFICGKGTDSTGGIQFAINGRNGWLYVIKARNEEKAARQEAERLSKWVLTEQEEYTEKRLTK